ncbi:ABC transporter substrate-binding protein [Pokkaliibacter plantistimulans]|uniref:ABC transporter substrate-binding protein n=1 Tax=Pokkaliibacter plantistimulans TaxID=1635171 RepID=A0ABX5M0D4_9GAMM|nr:TRAP transporter substrate-binding protein [Pokkaliibacter plantistimulans]PXF31859.1 ABC transporter substrate-binding protein [Pokkaliibacter plantistimulans]
MKTTTSVTTSKKVLKSLTAAVLGVTLSLGAVSSFAAEINNRLIRFGYGLSEDSKQGESVKFFIEEMKRLSDGKFKVKGFANASLGNEMQMQNALIGGAQEMMMGATSSLVGIDKRFGIWDLPFLFDKPEVADKVYDGKVGQELLDGLQAQGLVGLVYWENGFRDLTNSKRPIEKMSDMDGVKLRVMQNPMYLDLFNSMGANAIPMAFSELFTALETGAVDGQENPYTTIQSSKFYEVQKYMSLTHHVYSPWVMLISKSFWDKLSDDEKAIVKQAAVTSRDYERKLSREQAAESLAFLKQHMQVNDVPPAELDKMRAKAKVVVDAQAKELGEDLVKQLFTAIDEAKQQVN